MLWVCAEDLERGIDRFVNEYEMPPDIFKRDQVNQECFPEESCPFCQKEGSYLIVPMGTIKD